MYPRTGMPSWGVFVHKQVRALANLGHEVSVLVPSPRSNGILAKFCKKWKTYKNVSEMDIIDGIPVFYPKYTAIPKGFLKSYWGKMSLKNTQKIIKKYNLKFDLIHAHAPIPSGSLGVELKKIYHSKLIITIHGSMITRFPFKNRMAFRAVERVLVESDAVITVSRYLKQFVEAHFNIHDKVKVVWNGIDLDETEQIKSLKRPNNLPDGQICLTVGTFNEQKGYKALVHAIPGVLNKNPRIHFYFIGGGVEKKYLEKWIQSYKISKNVHMLGRLSNIETMQYMNGCDLFVLPSYDEGFGIVFIEAMAFKKPVIGCAGSGPDDIIDHGVNGMLINDRKKETLTKAILQLLDKESNQHLGLNGYNKVVDCFTLEKICHDIDVIYINALK